ncbi:multicopper oxidase family protein [Rhizobium sp. NRK18]|uniref:multicopper oxidase family protein n=1 Tax=Rhizobium sp. NRK18 TaxID=2964667 RepID=UPI0021C27715|nr:multicopper oxidase domain-containing protein [Rhizobium sp. NRK18]MCQ2004832.1 multicopper oxidase domain-containing protein [Rhizobium sp. NRK18]
MDRRDFLRTALGATTALAASSLPRFANAAAETPASPARQKLLIGSRTLEVNGRAAKVFSLAGPDGRPGLIIDREDGFDVQLESGIDEPTLVHWHGLTPPWQQDGVPGNPAAMLEPGETRQYAFALASGGTHWMHAHTLQEQNLLAAPLIVHTAEDRSTDEQEVVILLHDFSFTPAEELLARLSGGDADHGGMSMGGMSMGGMDHSKMGHTMGVGGMSGMSGMQGMAMMDFNDIEYDAYLANDRTLDDPEVIRIDKGGHVRLRIINAAASTAFMLSTGALAGTVVAVDGQPVEPVEDRAFPISMGQRIDIRLQIPAGGGAFPILAQREGARQRTGIVLASANAAIEKIGSLADEAGPTVGLTLETRLRALRPLADNPAARQFNLDLTGSMMNGYRWAIEGDQPKVRRGERIEIGLRNMTMMAHPIHLHGHHFQVVELDGKPLAGALRDTLIMPPMVTAKIAFDADNAGVWPLHCHHLYHMANGMMTHVHYEGIG